MKTAGVFQSHQFSTAMYTKHQKATVVFHCPGEYFETLGINVYDTWLPVRLSLEPSARRMDYRTGYSCLDIVVLDVD